VEGHHSILDDGDHNQHFAFVADSADMLGIKTRKIHGTLLRRVTDRKCDVVEH